MFHLRKKTWEQVGGRGTEYRRLQVAAFTHLKASQLKKRMGPGHTSTENSNLKRHMHPNVHCSTIHNSQDMEAT